MKNDETLMKSQLSGTGKVLLVEDDRYVREILLDTLKRLPLIVDEADTGESAIEKVSSAFYDLIIIDLVLPNTDGLDLLSWIKRHSPRTKIIMISAFATIDIAVNAIKKGADNFIPKPFRPADIIAIVQRTLEETRLIKRSEEHDIEGII